MAFCTQHKTHKQCYDAFAGFVVARKDSKICTVPIKQLRDNTQCSYVYLKKMLIRLRRQNNKEDWREFSRVFESHFDIFLKTMNARWLISMLDTYADYADPVKSRNALLATAIVNCEKMHMTKDLCFKQERNEWKADTQKVFAAGLTTFMMPNADMPVNFFKRMQEKLRSTPLIHAIYKKIMKSLILTKGTSQHFLAKESAVRSYLDPYYKHVLEEDTPCQPK